MLRSVTTLSQVTRLYKNTAFGKKIENKNTGSESINPFENHSHPYSAKRNKFEKEHNI